MSTEKRVCFVSCDTEVSGSLKTSFFPFVIFKASGLIPPTIIIENDFINTLK